MSKSKAVFLALIVVAIVGACARAAPPTGGIAQTLMDSAKAKGKVEPKPSTKVAP